MLRLLGQISYAVMDVNGSLVPGVAVIKSWGIITNQVFKIRASYIPDTLLTAAKQSLTLLYYNCT